MVASHDTFLKKREFLKPNQCVFIVIVRVAWLRQIIKNFMGVLNILKFDIVLFYSREDRKS